MGIPIYQIDAFASRPFTGNPAGVCLLEEPKPAEWMQNVAAEMNLAETAFVVPRKEAGGGFDLRWFTPATEVPLCGHATLASAHTLWETNRLAADQEARFHTLSGWLSAKKSGAMIEMDLPAFQSEGCAAPEALIRTLNLNPAKVICNKIERNDDVNYLVELDSEETVRGLKPDFVALRGAVTAGVIVTARGGSSKYDFVSRYFAGYVGIDEDPVTGAAHCMLAPYWAAKLGKTEMLAYQASPRGGEVNVRHRGDRVTLGGNAVMVLKGELLGQ